MQVRKLLAFGSGVGIEIRGNDMEIAAVRVRPSGVQVLGRVTLRQFRERPAAEWGAEYAAFLKTHGVAHLSATVLLPRRDVIARQLYLPGVSGRDLPSAVALQIDTLHPYGEEDVEYAWSPLGSGAVLTGIIRRAVLEQYAATFAEAGIAVASFTFFAAAVHGAARLFVPPPAEGFAALSACQEGGVEIYGESPARPVFAAEFDLPVDRAVRLALSELRLPPDTPPLRLDNLLPAPRTNPVENDLSRNALPYATALAGACPRLAPAANLLPPAHRTANSRAIFLPTAVLGGLLLLLTGALLAHSAFEDRRYLRKLEREIAALEPQARKAAALDRQIDLTRARARLLDEFRRRTSDDLEALDELSRLLPPPAWANSIELSRDAANIVGEAEQAAALLKVIDASPLFQDSEFSVIARVGNNENFRIHTRREGRR